MHVILDTAEQKGTGKWTSTVSLWTSGVPAQTIADGGLRPHDERAEEGAGGGVRGAARARSARSAGDRKEFIEMIRQALYASKICSYAQGFQLLRAANEEYKWDLNFGTIASLWRAGCIIRAQFLSKIKEAYDRNPALANLLLDPYFAGAIAKAGAGVAARRRDGRGARRPRAGVQFSALAYYDSYRSAVLPANLLQAQRDFFGAHTYRRIDREGVFHTQWEE